MARRRRAPRPQLVWIHGGPGLDHHLLEPVAHGLPDWVSQLPDLPGHGPTHRDLGLDATLRGLHRELSRIGPQVVWVGHSMGAWLLRELLRRDGGLRPAAAVWLAPPAGDQPEPSRQRPRRARSDPRRQRRDLLEQVAQETGRRPSDAFEKALQRAHLRAPGAHPRLLSELQRALARPTPRCVPGCPVLLVRGDADAVVGEHQAREVVSLTEGAQLAVVPGAGHYPAATGDDGFAQVVAEFLADTLRI